ncbi:MAG: ABC transporter ATP-binding protein [Candidatus Latescibacteria bacterium]|nr:ABC transporter ATP-binding protein [Candidatus Latescibacterota bacterium]
MMVPFLENIFYTEQDAAVVQAPSVPLALSAGASETPKKDSGLLDRWKGRLRKTTDRLIVGETRQQTFTRLCLVILALFFLKNLFGYAQGYLMAYAEQGLIKRFRDLLYEHLQALSLGYFHEQRTGRLISRIVNDVKLLNEAMNASLINLVRDPLMIFFYLSLMLTFSWKLTLAVLLVMPLSLRVILYIGKKLRKHSTRSQQRIADITTVLEETISGIRVVKAFAMEAFEIAKFRGCTDRFRRTMTKLTRIRRLASPLTEFLSVSTGIVILWIGGRQVLAGGLLAPAEFMTFLITMFLMMSPFKSLGNVYSRIQVGLAAGERIFEILDTPPIIRERPGAREIGDIREGLRFRDVSFSYPTGDRVLDHVDLQVQAGEVLAIVGPSGGGKSTLVDLIPRFYDPTAGAVEIDGVDLRDVKIGSLRRLMGIVTQETILFNDTVRNNIAYGHPEIEEARIASAARAANAHDFILEFPDGYETRIGDRGVKLSGGQRQRLAIARAILKNPPILIFDEATSSLDLESEQLVQEAIERLMQGRTAFVIAHRLSTVQRANRIVVMDAGRIVQEGTHAELVAQEGLYRKLYRMQFRNGEREA